MNKEKYLIEMIEEKFKKSTFLTVGEYELFVRAWETMHNTHDRTVFVQAKREVEQEAKEEPAPEGMGKSAYVITATADNSKDKDHYGYIMQRLEEVSQTESYLHTRDLANEIREKFPSVTHPHTGISRFLHRFMGMGKLQQIHRGFYKGVKK